MTLTSGSVYAVLASGMSLIFGVAHIVNLAHTAFYVLAAYFLWYFFNVLGLHPAASVAITLAATTGLGMLSYRFLLDRVRQHPQVVLLLTIALAMLIQEILLGTFEAHLRTVYPPLLPAGTVSIFGVTVQIQQLVIMGAVAVIMVGLWLFLSRTKAGVAVRATANDAEVASLMGISVSRTLLMVMGLGTALAGIAAMLISSTWVFYPWAWSPSLVMILAIIVLGGLGSIKGSILGAYIIALAETLLVSLAPQYGYLKTAVALAAMVIVLSLRPGGLFGIVFEEEKL